MYDIKNLNIWKKTDNNNVFGCKHKMLKADISKGKLEDRSVHIIYQKAFEEMTALLPEVDFVEIKERRNGKFIFPIYISEQLKNTELEELELSVRSINCLHRAGFKTIGELVDAIDGREDLRRIRNCGTKSADEIMIKLFFYQYYQLEKAQKINYVNKVTELNTIY